MKKILMIRINHLALTKFHFSSCNFQEIILVPMFYFYLKINNYLKKMVLVFYKNHSLFFMIIFFNNYVST